MPYLPEFSIFCIKVRNYKKIKNDSSTILFIYRFVLYTALVRHFIILFLTILFMNKKTGYLLLILFLSVSKFISAKPIDHNRAIEIAKSFDISISGNMLRSSVDYNLVMTDTSEIKDSKSNLINYFVYNIGDNQGFIIISGDDAAKEVIAYSDQGSFQKDKIPDNLKYWLNGYSRQMQYLFSLSESEKEKIAYSDAGLRSANAVVNPLLGNITWDQGSPYNILCPYSEKDKKRTVVGCVATAMAQIMKFYRWPDKGAGSKTYAYDPDTTIKKLTVNFGETTYDWDNMLNSYKQTTTPSQDTAAALLSYHCGVAVEMKYKSSGSAAGLDDAAKAFSEYFRYDPDIQLYLREFFTNATWSEKIISELNAGRPVLYGGSSDEAGHAFVCDGYDASGLFHFNWGWSGNGNGYFALSILDPEYAGIGSSPGGYSQNQHIVTGIQKDDGVTKNEYLMCLYSSGLSSNKATISDITSTTFTLSAGFGNFGVNTFSGNVGIALFKNDVFYKVIKDYSLDKLETYHGFTSYDFENLSLNGTPDGNYQICLYFKAGNSNEYKKMYSSPSLNNYVNLTVTGKTATITRPVTNPDLVLTSEISTEGKVYQNKAGRFNISIKNNGAEFYSYVNVYLVSTMNTSISQYLGKSLVLIGSGETKSVQLIGDLTLTPGNYNVYCVFDSTNNYSGEKYKRVSQSGFNVKQVTIYTTPIDPVLALTKGISIDGGSTIYANTPFTLNVPLTNTGGYFDDQILAFIFRSTGGTSVGYIGPQTIYLDKNESKTFKLTGSCNLTPGSYKIAAYTYISNATNPLTPSGYYVMNFTLKEQIVGIENPETQGIKLSSNPVGDKFRIISDERVLSAEVFDINGIKILTVTDTEEISSDCLKKGLYILRVKTENNNYSLKFIK